MKIVTHSIIAVVICIAPVSCRKCDTGANDYGQGTGNCRLATGDSAYNRLEYDVYSRITKIGNTTITYNGNILVARHAGAPYQLPYGYRTDSFELNERGQIMVRYGILPEPNTAVNARDEYTYDSEGHLVTIAQYYNGAYTGNINYKWAHGDVVEVQGGYKRYYKYDTTRRWQFAMVNNLSDYVFFGLPKYRTQHIMIQDSLIQYGSFGPDIDNYAYQYDDGGKIITCTNSSTWHSTYVTNFKYDCK